MILKWIDINLLADGLGGESFYASGLFLKPPETSCFLMFSGGIEGPMAWNELIVNALFVIALNLNQIIGTKIWVVKVP